MTALIPYTVIVSLLAIALAPLLCACALHRAALLARDPSVRLPARRCRLWVHCASVGEARLALRLIDVLVVRGCVARGDVVLTATNPTAVRLARASHPGTYLAPVDHLLTVRRVVRAVRPEVLVVLETELWPCYIAYARLYGAQVFLVNGRISSSTAVFLRLFRPLFAGSLDGIHRLLLREPLDAARFRALGVPHGRMAVAGNMKYDETVPPEGIYRSAIGRPNGMRTVVFGSVREGEERTVSRAVAALLRDPRVFCIVAPRHPRRSGVLLRHLSRAGVAVRLRSASTNHDARCLILDTLGELRDCYAVADVAVVCGSFARWGGQNPIEPAAFGVPVLFGPYMANFWEPARVLCAAGGAERLASGAEIPAAVRRLLDDDAQRRVRGQAARAAVQQLRGATERVAAEIAAALRPRSERPS